MFHLKSSSPRRSTAPSHNRRVGRRRSGHVMTARREGLSAATAWRVAGHRTLLDYTARVTSLGPPLGLEQLFGPRPGPAIGKSAALALLGHDLTQGVAGAVEAHGGVVGGELQIVGDSLQGALIEIGLGEDLAVLRLELAKGGLQAIARSDEVLVRVGRVRRRLDGQ